MTALKVTVEHVSKAFAEFPALDDVSVEIPAGQLVALLGPSGSGKTTLLRVIAGIDAPDRGRVKFAGDDVTDAPIQKRGVGFVFQDYALFEHMTVAENIAFGLSVRRGPNASTKEQIEARVRDLVERVQLAGTTTRYPRELSGGQRQRVALARALAPAPKLLLLDEPFGALDARVRAELRAWMRRLHDELHVTSVFVTHDQEEALEVADQIIVMNRGRIEQAGDPNDVFDRPTSAFVMDFLGGVNVLRGEVRGEMFVAGGLELPSDGVQPGPARAFVRGHDFALGRGDVEGAIAVTVSHVRRIGIAARVAVTTAENEVLTVELPFRELDELGVVRGAELSARVRSARIFPREEAR